MAIIGPQELTVRSWKAWEDRESDGDVLRDKYGNIQGSIVFEEHSGEQVDARFKEQPNPGDKKYGVIEDYQTKSGKTRTKFSRKDRPEANQPSYSGGGNSNGKSWTPRDDSAIQAQWAINQAREYIQFQLGDKASLTEILATAKLFYGMIEQVKGSDAKAEPEFTEKDVPTFDVDDTPNLDDIPF